MQGEDARGLEEDFRAFGGIVCDSSEVDMVKSLVLECEYSGKRLSTNTDVPGRLARDKKFGDFYEFVLKAEPYVVDTVRNGYRIPLSSYPPDSFSRNNRSARLDPPFVKAELERLCSLGCIEEVQLRPRICLPLSKVYSNKWR